MRTTLPRESDLNPPGGWRKEGGFVPVGRPDGHDETAALHALHVQRKKREHGFPVGGVCVCVSLYVYQISGGKTREPFGQRRRSWCRARRAWGAGYHQP
jgi:hypothetical protein